MAKNNEKKLPVKAKAGYMFGGAAQTTIVTLINVVLTYFYTNTMGINIAAVSMIMLVSRFLDGASDLVAGIIIDQTKSKYGKARPWLLRMCIPHLIGIIAMFTVPRTSESLQLVYIFMAYNFANTVVNTMAGLALSSLNSLMSRDPGERSQLNVLRQFGAPVMELAITVITIPLVNYIGGDQKAWIIVISGFSIVSSLCYFICFLWSKETNMEERGVTEEKVPVSKALKALLKNNYWYICILAWIAGTFYLTIFGTNLSYYCQYILGDVTIMSYINIAEKLPTIILTALLMPIVIPKFGKRNMMLVGACVVVIGHAITIFAPTNITLALLAGVLRGSGIAPVWASIFAMIADCVEFGQWKTGLRTEGIIFCAATIGQKFGQGIASATVGGLLGAAGFSGMLHTQGKAAVNMISKIYIVTPIITFGVIVILMLFYKLEKMLPSIIKDLDERRSSFLTEDKDRK